MEYNQVGYRYCGYCKFTGYVPTVFAPEGPSDFVKCPMCGNDADFFKKMGWSPRNILDDVFGV